MAGDKKRPIAIAVLGLFYAHSAQAHPGLPDLSGCFETLFVGALIVAVMLLIRAFYEEKTSRRILFALPAKLLVLVLTPLLLVWVSANTTVLLILLSLTLSVSLIHLHFKSFGLNHASLACGALAFVYVVAILLNPAYFGFVEVVPEDNDPFDGNGVTVLEVEDAGAANMYLDGVRQYRIDNILVLDDGRRVPGVFYQSEPGDVVMVKATESGEYAYEVYALKTRGFKEITPLVDYPSEHLFQRAFELNYTTEVIGWGHDIDW